MRVFTAMAVSASALAAERLRLDLISSNIANIDSAGRTGAGGPAPYRRKIPVFAQVLEKEGAGKNRRGGFAGAGVRVARIAEDPSPPSLVHNPSHPLADERGYVAYPNVNILNEMVDLMGAVRAYEANVTAFNTAKEMYLKALEIGRG